MKADSPACRRTAECKALPPSNTYNRGVLKSNPRASRSLSNAPTTVAFSVAPSRNPQHRFAPVAADAQRHNHLPIFERSAVDQHRAQPKLAQRALHQLLHFLAAGLDEILAHRRLLDPVGSAELFHHRPIIPSREAAHHFFPDSLFQRSVALE